MPVTLAPHVETREVKKIFRQQSATTINSQCTAASITCSSIGSSEHERPATLPVKNTFIDYPIDRPPSLEEFLKERQVRSWPTSLDDEREAFGSLDGEFFDGGAGGVRGRLILPEGLPVADASTRSAPAAGCAASRLAAAAGQQAVGAGAAGVTLVSAAAGHIVASAGEPALGSPEVPTVGSAAHNLRKCKPCAFALKGCKSGVACQFCHLCDPGEKKRRKKDRVVIRRNMSQLRQMYTGFML